MPKHTPGPWNVVTCGTGLPDSQKQFNGRPYVEHSLVAGPGKNVAHVYQGDRGPVGSPEALEEQKYNALLIAAAPELLATLTELLATYYESSHGPAVIAARAAVNKATGRQ